MAGVDQDEALGCPDHADVDDRGAAVGDVRRDAMDRVAVALQGIAGNFDLTGREAAPWRFASLQSLVAPFPF